MSSFDDLGDDYCEIEIDYCGEKLDAFVALDHDFLRIVVVNPKKEHDLVLTVEVNGSMDDSPSIVVEFPGCKTTMSHANVQQNIIDFIENCLQKCAEKRIEKFAFFDNVSSAVS